MTAASGKPRIEVSPEEWEALNARLRDAEEKLRALHSGAEETPLTDTPEEARVSALHGAARRDDVSLAVLAHELRNLLAPIRSAVEIMGLIGHRDTALDTARDVIARQVDQLSRLVDDVMDASRIAQPAPHVDLGRDIPRCIVVIDDNQDAAESLAMLLRLKGHEVHVAYDGPSGVSLALKTTPDCVLVDIDLPGIDGYEVAKRLRSHEQTGRALLIALTGYGQSEDRMRSERAGFDHHLVKPVAQDVLQVLICERRSA